MGKLLRRRSSRARTVKTVDREEPPLADDWGHMPIYQSMQRVRFSSLDDYRKFMVIFADTRNHLNPDYS
jgi:hypothetical protein